MLLKFHNSEGELYLLLQCIIVIEIDSNNETRDNTILIVQNCYLVHNTLKPAIVNVSEASDI